MKPYKDSSLYRLGQSYASIGSLLMDESTTLRDLVSTMADLDQSVQIRFVTDIDSANAEDEPEPGADRQDK